jgi:hypothetical protein
MLGGVIKELKSTGILLSIIELSGSGNGISERLNGSVSPSGIDISVLKRIGISIPPLIKAA